jgi:hypothetical protein
VLVDALVRAGTGGPWEAALAALWSWLEEVRAIEAPVLDGEGDAWLAAARAEARVCRQAVRLLETVRGVGAARVDDGTGLPGGGDDGGGPAREDADAGVPGPSVDGPASRSRRTADAPDPASRHRALAEGALALAMGAQAVRRSTHTTFGPRNSLRPVLSQHDDGEWRFHAASVEVGASATDALVAYALALVDAEG